MSSRLARPPLSARQEGGPETLDGGQAPATYNHLIGRGLRREGGLRTAVFPWQRQLVRLSFHLWRFQNDPPKKEEFNINTYVFHALLPSAITLVAIFKMITRFTYRGFTPYKFTPMPGVHNRIHKDARKLVLMMRGVPVYLFSFASTLHEW